MVMQERDSRPKVSQVIQLRCITSITAILRSHIADIPRSRIPGSQACRSDAFRPHKPEPS